MMTEEEKELERRIRERALRKAQERRNDLERIEAGEEPAFMPHREEPSVYARPGLELHPEEASNRQVSYQRAQETYYGSAEPERPGPETVENREPLPERPVKRHILTRLFAALFLLVLIFGVSLFAFIYFSASRTDYQPYSEIPEDPAWGLPESGKEGVVNILLIGTDGRTKEDTSRSDSIILCSICPLKHRIYLTSILRDSYTTIPDYGRNRINHAYQMGGARLLAETIEMNFHVRIDHYMKVDFFSFVDIIDGLGGVEVEIREEEVQYLNAYLCDVNLLTGRPAEEDFLSGGGTYLLTGRQALAYSRIRYIGTDFGRTSRQRTVLQAAFRKMKQAPLQAVRSAGGFLPELVTDYTEFDLTLLLLRAPFLAGYEIVQDQIPFDGTWWNDTMPNGQEVLNMDFEKAASILRERLYREP